MAEPAVIVSLSPGRVALVLAQMHDAGADTEPRLARTYRSLILTTPMLIAGMVTRPHDEPHILLNLTMDEIHALRNAITTQAILDQLDEAEQMLNAHNVIESLDSGQ